jgi:predicted ATPase with chaperone activity
MLYFDKFPEFRPIILEDIRQVIEVEVVMISLSQDLLTIPD